MAFFVLEDSKLKYNKTIITRPLSCTAGDSHLIDLPVGDTYFMSLKEWVAPTLPFQEADNVIPPQVRPSVYLEHVYAQICTVVEEGTDMSFTVRLTDTVATDTTVDWTITHGGVVAHEGLRDTNSTGDDTFSYINDVHGVSVDGDFAALTGSATVLAGNDSVVVTVGTVDDAVWTGGPNTFKVFTVTLSNLSDSSMLLLDGRDSATGLIEDIAATPALSGWVDLGIQMHDLVATEPLIDPSTGSQDLFILGVDDNGASNIRSVIIDDVPMVSMTFTPNTVVAADASDLTGGTVFVQAIIQSGRRD